MDEVVLKWVSRGLEIYLTVVSSALILLSVCFLFLLDTLWMLTQKAFALVKMVIRVMVGLHMLFGAVIPADNSRRE